MAWVERTFAEVDPPEDGPDEDVRLGEMLRNLPPYMKITTRRARKALEKYELMKQRHIENLRQNPLYKFVMQVAAFTNEDIGKYWKGKTLTPFMEDHTPEKITITRDDLDLIRRRAEENAFADLHQYCRRIRAVPVYSEGTFQTDASFKVNDSGGAQKTGVTAPFTPLKSPSGVESKSNPGGTPGGSGFAQGVRGKKVYIYDMTDTNFEQFIYEVANNSYPPDTNVIFKYYELDNGESTEESKYDPIVRWDAPYPEYWFQRYIAKLLVSNKDFRDRYLNIFNNVVKVDGVVYRDLTGMRLTEEDGNEPREFVRPLFEQRNEWWRHELVLGEYEKRSQYQADQWLQKTPWALGKMYIEPKLYGHMVEAHIAVTSRFKKFANATVEDLVSDEKHSFYLSKLVAMCIRTSAILSGKKYGLDKMYMRVNLEKKRLMYAWGKLEGPKRQRQPRYNVRFGGRIP